LGGFANGGRLPASPRGFEVIVEILDLPSANR
jgi:hypothetical protein